MEKLLLSVFFGVFIIAGLGALVVIQQSNIGNLVHPPQYVSCHYVDQDQFGPCMRVEKQLGVRCSPEETGGLRNMDDEGRYWGNRPCVPVYGTDKW